MSKADLKEVALHSFFGLVIGASFVAITTAVIMVFSA